MFPLQCNPKAKSKGLVIPVGMEQMENILGEQMEN